MLLLKIGLNHMERKAKRFKENEIWYPDTCKIGSNLTCNVEHKNTGAFQELEKEASQVVQDCNNKLRNRIYRTEKIQENDMVRTIQEKQLKTCLFLQNIYMCHLR